MTSAATPERHARADFARRADRAERLAEDSLAAREPLLFAAGLYRAQGGLAALLAERHGNRPFAGRLDEDVLRLVEAQPELLTFVSRQGPPQLAEQAAARAGEPPAEAASRLLAWWTGERDTREDYLSRALLRPYVESLAGLGVKPSRPSQPGHCPFCAGPPWIASLRSEEEAEGAARHLVCALCGREWPFGRILCPGCGEEDPRQLPAFQSEKHPGVRLQACDSCRGYLKAIDLSLDARPIPEVDDLVSLGMDLWAAEQGYTRLEPGLAGL